MQNHRQAQIIYICIQEAVKNKHFDTYLHPYCMCIHIFYTHLPTNHLAVYFYHRDTDVWKVAFRGTDIYYFIIIKNWQSQFHSSEVHTQDFTHIGSCGSLVNDSSRPLRGRQKATPWVPEVQHEENITVLLRSTACLSCASWLSQAHSRSHENPDVWAINTQCVYREIPSWDLLLEEILDMIPHTIHFN